MICVINKFYTVLQTSWNWSWKTLKIISLHQFFRCFCRCGASDLPRLSACQTVSTIPLCKHALQRYRPQPRSPPSQETSPQLSKSLFKMFCFYSNHNEQGFVGNSGIIMGPARSHFVGELIEYFTFLGSQ